MSGDAVTPSPIVSPLRFGVLDLYTVEHIRAIEARVFQGIGSRALMRRAGAAVARAALARSDGPFLVLAGPGNNGGDALDAAAELRTAFRDVHAVVVDGAAPRSADASAALERCVAAGVSMHRVWPDHVRPTLIIDGLFGIGLKRPIEGLARGCVEAAARSSAPVLAIDVPSGIDADTGAVVGGASGIAMRASFTLTLLGNKPGLYTGAALDYAGSVEIDALGCEDALGPGDGILNTPDSFDASGLCRARDSHKGHFGTVQIVGGAPGMTGAAVLAARAALHAGAGRVVLVPLDARFVVDAMCPEIMVRSIDALDPALGPVVIGPGLGDSALGLQVLQRVVRDAPIALIDADGLNALARDTALRDTLIARSAQGAQTVLTPHPLEAARLLGIDVHAVLGHRIRAACDLAAVWRAHVALKGAGTVLAAPDGTWRVNPTGNPALATGGTGDVLAGVAGALLAIASAADAISIAVWAHGAAADDLLARGVGPIGLSASELIASIRARLNRLAVDG